MGTSLDSRDDRHAYIGYIFQNLNAFVVNLAPNAGIGGIAEGGPLDIRNELPTSAREDYDFVCSNHYRTSSLVHACKTCSSGQWTPEPITRPDDVSIARSVPTWSKEAFALKLSNIAVPFFSKI